MVGELLEKTRGKKVIAIAAGEETALALIRPQARMMTGRAAVAGLPQASDVNELGASFIHPSASPASQHTTVTADNLKKGEGQSVQVSTGDSSVTTTVSGGNRTVRGTVSASSAQAGNHAPLVVDLTAMSLEVTVTSTDGERPSPTVRLTFNEITVGDRPQPTTPAPNTTIPFDGGGRAVLNHQQPSDTGIQVTAVALFDNSGREVARARPRERPPTGRHPGPPVERTTPEGLLSASHLPGGHRQRPLLRRFRSCVTPHRDGNSSVPLRPHATACGLACASYAPGTCGTRHSMPAGGHPASEVLALDHNIPPSPAAHPSVRGAG